MEQKYFYKVVLAAVIFNDKKEVLLGKRSSTEDVLPGLWGLPGGKVDATENVQSVLEEDLKREVFEEVGVKISDLQYLESHLSEDHKINISFTAQIKSGVPKPLDETEEVKWVKFEELENFKLTPHTFERIKLAYSLI
ncbi:MAG: NUDIX domain-containing protein [Candidatus Diapherotrites archaeon]|nr:NUDIX domain-containing protein [Candidatus Diapherotrites archaeon]